MENADSTLDSFIKEAEEVAIAQLQEQAASDLRRTIEEDENEIIPVSFSIRQQERLERLTFQS